ncbi:LemA family protein [Gordonia oryzae]|uniref:LemA family protein n=1 Tax=Gordonia oryzae TaxID=2487349 RepID=A0A3N4GAZ0_9ACTN|nr:LemA family protein [Gordonia oryzae]RPA58547.1 LemA family protein [Gordonia oryzae]
MSTWIAVIVVVVVLAGVGVWYLSAFNAFVRLRNLVAESWKQVDVELQRRHDLVPNLVAAVRQAASFEQGVLESVTRARTDAQRLTARDDADVAAVAAAEELLSTSLTRMQALAEQYPQVQAVRGYDALRRELADTEDRIAAARRLYNANVRALNTRIESMPSAWVAAAHHVGRAEYFEPTSAAVGDVPDVGDLLRTDRAEP